MLRQIRKWLGPVTIGVLSVAGIAAGLFALTAKPPRSEQTVQGNPAVFERPFPKSPPPRADLNKLVEKALVRGVEYLIQQQRKDGSWRSQRYESFQDGTALTPLAAYALECVYDSSRPQDNLLNNLLNETKLKASVRRSVEFLMRYNRKDGTLNLKEDELPYPVYTASLTLLVLSPHGAHPLFSDFRTRYGFSHEELRGGWMRYLKDRQLTARLGWHPEEDVFYGGWGYCRLMPRAPKSGELTPPLLESNLSATAFALEALQAVGELDDETRLAARRFVLRCQNWSQPPGPGDDGGFFFIPNGDPVRNKAGRLVDLMRAAEGPSRNLDNIPGEKMVSYGSATADGLIAMLTYTRPTRDIYVVGPDKKSPLAVQLREDDKERIKAAMRWLLENGHVCFNPPNFANNPHVIACRPRLDGAYFYYLARVAQLDPDGMNQDLARSEGRDNGAVANPFGIAGPWTFWEALAWQLCQLQRPDGFWVNPYDFMREDEPIVATSFALLALSRFDRSAVFKQIRQIRDTIGNPGDP